METIFQYAGGTPALHRFVEVFYTSVLADPLLQPLFGAGQPGHVDHLTAFEAESFGGPDDFTRQLGFAHLIDVHRGLQITEAQRQRFVDLYLTAADTAGLPDDPPFRAALARTWSSAPRSPCRTPGPGPTTSCIRCVRCRSGSGTGLGHPDRPAAGAQWQAAVVSRQ